MEPMTVIAATAAAVRVVSEFLSARSQNKQAEADIEASYKAGSFDLSTLQNQLEQMIQSTQVEVNDRQRQGAKDRAKILAAAGEANISGNSLMRLQAANMLDESRDKSIYKTNLENQMNQTKLEAYKVRTEASTNANYAKSQRVNPYLRTLAVGASEGANVYGTYQREQYR